MFPRSTARFVMTFLASLAIAALAMVLPRQSALAGNDDDVITIVLTGDTGFSRNHSHVNPRGVKKYGKLQPFAEALSAIKSDIDGDLNFTNIETVVTARNNMRRDTKGQGGPFNFRSHPNSMRTLVKAGFNVFSLANNHSMDYGRDGLFDTLKYMQPLTAIGLRAYAGIGANREAASRPRLIETKGTRIGFAAIGIVTNNLARHRAGPDKPGQIAYRFPADFALSTKRLAELDADFRILSIHYGVEGRVRTDGMQIKEWRRQAAKKLGIDLIAGHHAHVVRGVEMVGNSVIFYGLGNFIHHGTANMAGKGICRSYGLMAKLHLRTVPGGKPQVRAIEAIPVTKMHWRTQRYASVHDSHTRIHALNYLAATLDNSKDGARGVRFTPQQDGSGLFCMKGAQSDPGRIGKLCRNWRPAPAIPQKLRRRIAASCRRHPASRASSVSRDMLS